MTKAATKFERYSDGEYYARVNGRACWVLRQRDGGWRVDVTDEGLFSVTVRWFVGGARIGFAEAKAAAVEIATTGETPRGMM